MPIAESRSTILFIPVIRGNYPAELTVKVKAEVRKAADKLGLDTILPDDDKYTKGVLQSNQDIVDYWNSWKTRIHEIKGVIAFSADFMRERVVQDLVRQLPEDAPVFLIVNNDNPVEMVQGKNMGDALCGSLSIHHNMRMIGRRVIQNCRINMYDAPTLEAFLARYDRVMTGIETLRNMRIGMLGINPNEFATTFNNQLKLFELGFSLHTYELITLWGDTVLAKHAKGEKTYEGEFGPVKLTNPIAADDPRVGEVVELMKQIFTNVPDADKCDMIARCFLWIKDTFEADYIDAGTVHCWGEFARFFTFAPCSIAVLCNQLLKKPVVCEGDLGHAIMTKLGSVLTGEPAVILDVNNNGWDPRVFNVFHCSQTPTNWIKGDSSVGSYGSVEGKIAPVPFTAVAAGTSATDFHAVVFQGRFINEDPGLRGTSGWAFVPNMPEVLKVIEECGIHHFSAMKGHLADDVAEILAFRGIDAINMAEAVPSLEEIEKDLPELNAESAAACPVYTM
ncbi:MAG: hypothetical protein ACLFUS_10270 [Candidatus Sumerlaeia bacterium]